MREPTATVHLFIIGTAHSVQCAAPGADVGRVAAFEHLLRSTCREHPIARIAEEMTEAALKRQGVQRTVGSSVASDLGIEHQMVDLDPGERHALSLDNGPLTTMLSIHSFPDGGRAFHDAVDALADAVRERVWIGRLLVEGSWPALFVCGDDHCDSVTELWRSLQLPVTVLARVRD